MQVPIICIANDRNALKLKPLVATTFSLPFRRPDANAVRSRIMTVLFKCARRVVGTDAD
jgi:replication factor C subunit 1